MDINAKGVWLSLKHEIPAMLQTGGGAIVEPILGHVARTPSAWRGSSSGPQAKRGEVRAAATAHTFRVTVLPRRRPSEAPPSIPASAAPSTAGRGAARLLLGLDMRHRLG